MERKADFDEDNLIYNRFDLIYKNDFEEMEIVYQGQVYSVALHRTGQGGVLNVWGKELPQLVFEQTVEKVFNSHADIRYIDIVQSGNDYQGGLRKGVDIRIPLPDTKQELMQRLKAKHRYNLKRQRLMLEAQWGALSIESYEQEIPLEYVELYFLWKKESHGTDYGLTPQRYLQEYHVTDAMLVRAGERPIGIIFFCLVENVVYLENFSYDRNLAEYSPGYITYVLFLEELISRNCRLLFLGGGDYNYKKRFGAEERTVYNGVIYRKEVFDEINGFLKAEKICTYAIYGLGTVGGEFLGLHERIGAKLLYGIDREEKKFDMLHTFTPEEELPDVDAVFITLKSYNAEVERYLRQRFANIFYWEDMSKKAIFKRI